MRLAEIRAKPTVVLRDEAAPLRLHESHFRSFNLLEKVKEFLRAEVPPEKILEIIEDVELAPERSFAESKLDQPLSENEE